MKIRIHYNRRAKDGNVWTVHTSKGCYHVFQVDIRTRCFTDYDPHRDYTAKACIVTWGKLRMLPRESIAVIEE